MSCILRNKNSAPARSKVPHQMLWRYTGLAYKGLTPIIRGVKPGAQIITLWQVMTEDRIL